MKYILPLLIAGNVLYSSMALANIDAEECELDPDLPCIYIGEDIEEVYRGELEFIFSSPTLYNQHFRVIDIVPVPGTETEETPADCFVQVEAVPTPPGLIIEVDNLGQSYVEDFDNALKPIDNIAINAETCSSPIKVPDSKRNLP